ncbi:hypothetical protein [Leptolyngbya sp. PCC 6406]|uniref:hypothetical protein n=1 Tax=Leptolyngbya sp. PCC 6406 TaxID=1173264 RepID=UPI0002ACA9B8|nr:hypothetical protein [Leptolyngbya sp. PCC 6406]
MERFTRREAMILTRTSASRLAYLAKTGIVIPYRLEQGSRSQVFYSWGQILELRTINHLRRQTSLQTIRKILAFLAAHGDDPWLHNKHLIITEGEVTWVRHEGPNTQGQEIVRVAGRTNRHVGQLQLLTLPKMAEIVADLWETARHSQVIDFEHFKQRARSRQEE